MSITVSPVSAAVSRPAIMGLGVSVGLATVAGLLLTAGYALHPLWWAPWLAPVPLIVAGQAGAGRSEARQARIAGGIAGLIALVSVLPYYIEMNGWTATILIALLRISSWIFASRLAQAAARRLPLGLAMLVLPAAIAALEMLTLAISPHGAAGSLAYSQMDMPGAVQVAALGGVPAVVFVVLLPGSLAGLLLTRDWPRAQAISGLAAAAAAGAAIALFTLVRLNAPATGPMVPVTMIATDRFPTISPDWDPVWEVYRSAVEHSAKEGGLVVLPEKIALLDRQGSERAAAMVAETARMTRATIVVGIEVKDAGLYRNRALVAGPDGRTAWYDKQRPVPGWEARDVPGKTPLLADLAGARFGVAICKDMHIPAIAREYADAAALLAVPAWDFGQDGWMGARMSALRAVENGYAMARSARDGFVGAYDRSGRVLTERASGQGVTVADAALPATGHETIYARIGDVFGWTTVTAVLLLLVWFRRPIAG
jgi:apolipoprotein N-acyltransferase